MLQSEMDLDRSNTPLSRRESMAFQFDEVLQNTEEDQLVAEINNNVDNKGRTQQLKLEGIKSDMGIRRSDNLLKPNKFTKEQLSKLNPSTSQSKLKTPSVTRGKVYTGTSRLGNESSRLSNNRAENKNSNVSHLKLPGSRPG